MSLKRLFENIARSNESRASAGTDEGTLFATARDAALQPTRISRPQASSSRSSCPPSVDSLTRSVEKAASHRNKSRLKRSPDCDFSSIVIDVLDLGKLSRVMSFASYTSRQRDIRDPRLTLATAEESGYVKIASMGFIIFAKCDKDLLIETLASSHIFVTPHSSPCCLAKNAVPIDTELLISSLVLIGVNKVIYYCYGFKSPVNSELCSLLNSLALRGGSNTNLYDIGLSVYDAARIRLWRMSNGGGIHGKSNGQFKSVGRGYGWISFEMTGRRSTHNAMTSQTY